ncbi:uncharacterized protein LOC115531128 [Gadus morhua]|uniref:uncharacterized protein LOC115531128 n=1 Tax=Gadus morhua TaxID=8049 RepID=UPI0011B5E6AA|nr:uncharacterized protein LOC115531128 [Gadus morhua]
MDLVWEFTERDYRKSLKKKETLQLFVDFEKLIPKMETPELERECYNLYSQLLKKKTTTEQKKKLRRLRSLFVEKRIELEQDSQLTERMYTQLHMETKDLNRRLTELIDQLHDKMLTPKQKWKLNGFIHRLLKDTEDLEMAFVGGAAGEGTSGPSSTPLLSPELPAGLETSIPPAPSSETQPAETTPLMSSESPAPTGDQQEHTSRTSTPDVTMDGHDDDQSLDALAYRSGTGQLDIEMGPVQTLPKDRNRIL